MAGWRVDIVRSVCAVVFPFWVLGAEWAGDWFWVCFILFVSRRRRCLPGLATSWMRRWSHRGWWCRCWCCWWFPVLCCLRWVCWVWGGWRKRPWLVNWTLRWSSFCVGVLLVFRIWIWLRIRRYPRNLSNCWVIWRTSERLTFYLIIIKALFSYCLLPDASLFGLRNEVLLIIMNEKK